MSDKKLVGSFAFFGHDFVKKAKLDSNQPAPGAEAGPSSGSAGKDADVAPTPALREAAETPAKKAKAETPAKKVKAETPAKKPAAKTS
jgi:hypothetical protein